MIHKNTNDLCGPQSNQSMIARHRSLSRSHITFRPSLAYRHISGFVVRHELRFLQVSDGQHLDESAVRLVDFSLPASPMQAGRNRRLGARLIVRFPGTRRFTGAAKTSDASVQMGQLMQTDDSSGVQHVLGPENCVRTEQTGSPRAAGCRRSIGTVS